MAIRRIHVLGGLLVALPLLVQAFTGALLVFESEIDAWLNSEYFFVDPAGTPLTSEQQFDAFAEARPDMESHVYIMRLPQAANQATLMLAKPYDEIGPRRGVRFFVNPYTGEVGGDQPYHSTFMGKVYNLHRTFWLPRWGRWITSTSALLTSALAITGLLTYWVGRRSQQPTSEGLLIRLHRRAGLYFAPLVFVIALNGAGVTYRFLVIPFLYYASGTEMPKSMREGKSTRAPDLPGERRRSLDELIAAANEHFPEAEPKVLLQPRVADTAVTVILKKPHEPRDSGGTMVSMHPYTGQALGWTDFTDGEMGHQAVYWMLHLHKGTWGGIVAGEPGKLASQVAWIIAALVTCALVATGCVSWLRGAGRNRSTDTPQAS